MDNLSEKGALLKKVRESKGISLDTVHEHTKIPIDALRAIEEGYTIRTLSPFYQKGFLKIYAQFLEYDVKELLGDFKPKEVVSDVALRKYSSSSRGTKAFPFQERNTLSFQIKKFQKFFTSERLFLIAKVLGLGLAVFLFFKTIGFVAAKITAKDKKGASARVVAMQQSMKAKKEKTSRENRPTVEKVEEKISKAVAVVAEEKAKEKVATPALVHPTEDSFRTQEVHQSVVLSVRAQKNSWLQVKVDGTTVFEAVLKRGVSETWTAQQDIEVSGKSLNQLEFEVNGKMIGALGRGESRAKTVVVTKNGLSLKK